MAYTVLVSRTFQKSFHELQKNTQDRIRKQLQEIKDDPVTSRTHCDIKVLQDTDPRKYRLRVGDYRIIYLIDKNKVNIIELIKREVGYDRL